MKMTLRNRCKEIILVLMVLLFSQGLVYADNSYSNNASTAVSDSYITTKVKAQLFSNSETHLLNIAVETNNGLVTLSGTVGTVSEAVNAVQIAQSTQGVKDVDASGLILSRSSNQPLTDSYITAKVKGIFIQDKLFGSSVPIMGISVTTKNGTVYLSGTVSNRRIASRAVSLAKEVDGVNTVVSVIKVGRSS